MVRQFRDIMNLIGSRQIQFVQERLGVLDATCAARKRLPLRTSVIRRRRLSQWGIETRH